jgi:acetyl-CoA carboxylase carboxyl transferase subunit beta
MPPENSPFTCPHCGRITAADDFEKNLRVCLHCGLHARLRWQERLACTVDPGSFEELDRGLQTGNPIGFPGYEVKVASLRESCAANEGTVTGVCTVLGEKAVLGIMDSYFMMGSMGSVVGEKIARALEYGTAHKLPVIMFTASGGARMQEGIFSLMQMAKTAGAAGRHGAAGLLYISVFTDPTTGGVAASFAFLGDIIIAEPGALIGFAGKRVIQDTIGQRLPQGFQSAEFVLEHGFADIIVSRTDMRQVLARLLKMHRLRRN